MHPIEVFAARQSAVLGTAELTSAGVSRARLARAVADGDILRLRRARYCLPALDPHAQQALAIGGRLHCVSSLARRGVWVTERPALHVHVAPNASRLGAIPPNAVLHWEELRAEPELLQVSALDAVLSAARCQPRLDAIASIDSALNQGLATLSELERHADRRLAGLLACCDGSAQSGLESLPRVALRDLGLRVRTQVRIDAVGRVDLLVEDAVIVEADGGAYHDGPRRHLDHQRDAAAAALGYIPLRFDAHQILRDLPGVIRAIVGALQSHRTTPFSGRRAMSIRRRVDRAH